MYYSVRRLSYLVTFLTETAIPIDLIFDMYIHGTLGNVIGYIILTFQVIKDHLWAIKTHCEDPEEVGWAGGYTFFVHN